MKKLLRTPINKKNNPYYASLEKDNDKKGRSDLPECSKSKEVGTEISKGSKSMHYSPVTDQIISNDLKMLELSHRSALLFLVYRKQRFSPVSYTHLTLPTKA